MKFDYFLLFFVLCGVVFGVSGFLIVLLGCG